MPTKITITAEKRLSKSYDEWNERVDALDIMPA